MHHQDPVLHPHAATMSVSIPTAFPRVVELLEPLLLRFESFSGARNSSGQLRRNSIQEGAAVRSSFALHLYRRRMLRACTAVAW
jgi:hypothetical protein